MRLKTFTVISNEMTVLLLILYYYYLSFVDKYFPEEWKQIYQFSLKSKTTETNSAATYFP